VTLQTPGLILIEGAEKNAAEQIARQRLHFSTNTVLIILKGISELLY
jgi:hypothetical protein